MGQILLVRHGQASFGADDYDVLSANGEEQARRLGVVLGRALGGAAGAAGGAPDLIVHGSLVRQRATAEILAEAAGWTASRREDDRWNELDQLSQFATIDPMPAEDQSDRDAFQRWYAAAMDRWCGGEHDADYTESYAGFLDRGAAALAAVADAGTVVVVTSGGPICAVVTRLLGAGAPTYARLLPTTVNTGVTRVLSGRSGLTLLSFNEHSHLDAALRSYR